MYEWSPKGYYSGSSNTDQRPQARTYRHWEENWDQGRMNVNMTTSSGLKIRDYQTPSGMIPQFQGEDVGIPPYVSSSKKKKGGASDPRFKRVINTEFRSEPNAEKLSSTQKAPHALDDQANEDKALKEKVISFLKTPNEASMYSSPSLKNFGDLKDSYQQDLSDTVTKDVDYQHSERNYRGCNGANYFCDNLQDVPIYDDPHRVKSNSKANLQRSASDCTLHTKNAFLKENEDEASQKVRQYPSTTRLSKVHNWMKEYKLLPEKRRSVITVIGQTQTKPFSKILSEINQRRKLAKELDKHALCEAIMESTESQEVKNLVAKVDFVLPDGKVIYSAEKVYLCKDSSFKTCGAYSQKNIEILDVGDQRRKRSEMIPERDSSVSQMGKKSKLKRSSKRLTASIREKTEVKGKLRYFVDRFSTKLFWFLFLFLCLSLVFSAFLLTVKPSHTYYLAEIFRPKTTSWYEKLLL